MPEATTGELCPINGVVFRNLALWAVFLAAIKEWTSQTLPGLLAYNDAFLRAVTRSICRNVAVRRQAL